MKPTLVHLPAELIERLDQRVGREGSSRSQVIREAVAAYLDLNGDLAEEVRRAYQAHPLDTPDERGDLESFLEAVRSERNYPGEVG